MFLTTDTDHLKKATTRLYVLEMYIDGREKPIYKVGKASGKSSKDRMLSIAGSYFDKYRELPRIKIVRDRVVDDVFAKETEVHHILAEKSYTPIHKFSGCTELFDADKDMVLNTYDKVIGESLSLKTRTCKRCTVEKTVDGFKGRDRICKECKEKECS